MEQDHLLTPCEVAEYLRVSESTVYRLLMSGVIPGVKVGRSWRVKKEALDDFLAKGNFAPDQDNTDTI